MLALSEAGCFGLIWAPVLLQDETLPNLPRLGQGKEPQPTRYAWEQPGRHLTEQGVLTATTGQVYAFGKNDEWLLPGVRVGVTAHHLGLELFDIVYSQSVDGFRVSRPTVEEFSQGGIEGQIAFFGGSFTFGEAVKDASTLPSVVQQLGVGKWRAYNFGVGGGGAHEMLALLQGSRLASTMQPELASAGIYLAIHDHIRRVAGRGGAWQIGRPEFRLNEQGNLIRWGSFEAPPGSSTAEKEASWKSFWCRFSATANVLTGALSMHQPATLEEDVQLWIAIVKEARQQFRKSYGGDLHVVIWPGDGGRDSALVKTLEQHAVPFLDLTESLGKPRGYLVPINQHPTPHAYEVVGRALLPLLNQSLKRPR